MSGLWQMHYFGSMQTLEGGGENASSYGQYTPDLSCHAGLLAEQGARVGEIIHVYYLYSAINLRSALFIF